MFTSFFTSDKKNETMLKKDIQWTHRNFVVGDQIVLRDPMDEVRRKWHDMDKNIE